MQDVFLVHLTTQRWRELTTRVDSRAAPLELDHLEALRLPPEVGWLEVQGMDPTLAANDNTLYEDEAA